jgi:uncharacterized protein YdhG (YjbR/CyaY superfamily)
MGDAVGSVDAYVASFAEPERGILERARTAIRAVVPDAEETVRYDMAAFMLGGRYAIHFAGWKQHLGLYPVPVFDGPLEAEVAPYRSGKDSVRFRYRDPLPEELITRIAAEIGRMRAGSAG